MISFDCFDTLITRKVAEPQGVWMILEHKMKIFNFTELRKFAEYVAKQKENAESVGISNIYKIMSELNYIDKNLEEKIMQMEIELELELSIPISENIDKVVELTKNGEKIIIISDMYLPSSIIKQLLVKANPIFENIPIFVSCEFGKSKWSSNLYRAIQEKLNLKFSEWTHFGDNIGSDFNVPKKLGIKPIFLEKKPLNDNLKKILEYNENSTTTQLVVGIASFLENNNTAYNFGAFYGAVRALNYCHFILQKSIELNIKRLYFIARDGYLPKLICDILISNFNYAIKTEYVYFSREAVQRAIDNRDPVAKEYFESKIDISDDNFAFVDILSKGITPIAVMDILGYKNKLNLFVLSLIKSIEVINSMEKINFFFLLGLSSLSEELFFRAPHGKTIGWVKENKNIVPIFSKESLADVFPQYLDYINGILDFSKQYAFFINDFPLEKLDKILDNLLLQDKNSLKFLGDIPFDVDSYKRNIGIFSIVPLLSKKNIIDKYLFDIPLYIDKKLSVARMSKFDKKIMELCKKNRNTLISKICEKFRIFYSYIMPENRNNFSRKLPVCYSYNVGKYEHILNKKIILYGAGVIGRNIYTLFKITKHCKILFWADKKWGNIGKIANYDFDFVIIAIKNEEIVRDVKLDLKKNGILSEKILDLKN